ncbi:hypothetical protein [Demequina sp.]|uniref:hypothetical protein n=1 Tax=Demequina sp. TaxID=2050685 RepID=UPI003D11D27B
MTVIPARPLASPSVVEQLLEAAVWTAFAGAIAPWCMLVSNYASTSVDEPLLVLVAQAAWISAATRAVVLVRHARPRAAAVPAGIALALVAAVAIATARGDLLDALLTYRWAFLGGLVVAAAIGSTIRVEDLTSSSVPSELIPTLQEGGTTMTEQHFLERDADLLDKLPADLRRGLEYTLTSHAIEDMEPTREHTAALVDYTLGEISEAEYLERLGMSDLARRAAAARAAGE